MASVPALDTLPTEILTQIYLNLPTVASVLNLSATSHYLRSVYRSSKRLTIIFEAADAEFGPIDDIVQLVTHNASQAAHAKRSVGVSDALIQQIVHVGRIAQQWTNIYPLHKWNYSYTDRRLLTATETYIFRRALYRLWLFNKAFHTSAHSRYSRLHPHMMHERALLLHNFNGQELAEMLDVHLVIRDVVATELFPSDLTMRYRLQDQHMASPLNIHLNYAGSILNQDHKFFFPSRFASNPPPLRLELNGWGDEIKHYYIVEDMMKLNPEQLLHLHAFRHSRFWVRNYVTNLGEWFDNNGEVFSETLGFVLRQRGSDLEELKAAVHDEEAGIVSVM